MVHARTGLNGLKGKLSLEDRELVFRPETNRTGETRFSLGEIRKARRVRGSPILEIALSGSRREVAIAPSPIGFYFIKPPSLDETQVSTVLRRRTVRKRALTTLRMANATKKNEVIGWVEAIRRAQG